MGIEFGDDHDNNCGDFFFKKFGQEINNEKIEMNKTTIYNKLSTQHY